MLKIFIEIKEIEPIILTTDLYLTAEKSMNLEELYFIAGKAKLPFFIKTHFSTLSLYILHLKKTVIVSYVNKLNK